MKVLTLMGLFPKEYKEEIKNNTLRGMQNAANKLQWAIVEGLDENLQEPVDIINSLYIGSFPKKYRTVKIPTFRFSHASGSDDINIGFINLPVFKSFSRYYGIKKFMSENLNKHDKAILVVYAMTFPFMQIIKYVKKRHKNVAVCLVVPDLPEYMNSYMINNFFYRHAKSIQNYIVHRCIRDVDYFVLLADAMKEWFGRDIKYTVVEGMASNNDNQPTVTRKSKSIVYSGMIEEMYGIFELVDAFIRISSDEWSLDIFGDGSALHKIGQIAKADSRIHVHGLVPNEVVLKAQREAMLLVNPRCNNHPFTKYSFPSKIIEYMNSGTPMLAYKLDGMPDDYLPYFYRVQETDDGLYKSLVSTILLTEEELNDKGIQAKKFIAENKNAKAQCQKIISLFKDCINEEEDIIR